MKLAIIGSRTVTDYGLLRRTLTSHFPNVPSYSGPIGYVSPYDEIISGGAQGADSLGARFARENGIKLTEYLPDWETYGKRAGFVRNETIVSNSDFVLAIWDGISKGTANSLSIAKRLKKPTLIIYV